jgi:hypothetical protein
MLIERPASPTVKKELLAKAKMTEDLTATAPLELAAAMDVSHRHYHGNGHITARDLKSDAGPAFTIEEKTTAEVGPAQKVLLDTATEHSTSSTATSLLTSPTITVPLSEDPIEAIDDLEDALEEVGKILPKIEPVSPEKPIAKKKAPLPPRTGTAAVRRTAQRLTAKLQTPARAAAIGPMDPMTTTARKPESTSGLARTTRPSALNRSQAPSAKASTFARTPAAAKRQSMTLPAKDGSSKANGNTDYLASRRRPISMHFPAPPAPAKSTKPPTKPTFTLPGDAIAARKRAQLEEKRRKEDEELAKARQFKARPLPNQSKPRPASVIVKQTASSRARMSIYGGDGEMTGTLKENLASNSLKRSGTVTGTISSSVKKIDAAARAIMILPRTPSNTAQKRGSIVVSSRTDVPRALITIPKRQSLMTTTQPSAVRHMSSPSRSHDMSGTSSTNNMPGSKSIITAEDVVKQRQKGREVFNRDRVVKEEREKERREKEEAAKRARADAAERGRQASREWAEKQKKKLLEAKIQQAQAVGGADA